PRVNGAGGPTHARVAAAKTTGAGRGVRPVPTVPPAANPPISPAAASPLPACAGCAAASAEMLMAVTRPAMAFFIVALLKSREPMRIARPLLVIELWPNSLTEYLRLQISRLGLDGRRRRCPMPACRRAPDDNSPQARSCLLIP